MTNTHPAAGIVANPSELLAVMKQLAEAARAARAIPISGRPTVVQAYEAGRLAADAEAAADALHKVVVTASIYCEDRAVRDAMAAHEAREDAEAGDRG